METLSTWIFAVLLTLASPEKVAKHSKESVEEMKTRYQSIANDMAEVITTSEPLFESSDNMYRTAAVLSSLALYESSFHKSVDVGDSRGDNGRSWCLMQINLGKDKVRIGSEEMKTWKGKDLVEDRKKCFKVGLEMVRKSINSCNSNNAILSVYTSGKCLKNEKKAQKRWDTAMTILKRHPRQEKP